MRLMEQPWTVSEEKRIIERLLVAEWTSGGVARFIVCLLLPSKGAPLPRRSPPADERYRHRRGTREPLRSMTTT
jgi:hypothetical protein